MLRRDGGFDPKQILVDPHFPPCVQSSRQICAGKQRLSGLRLAKLPKAVDSRPSQRHRVRLVRADSSKLYNPRLVLAGVFGCHPNVEESCASVCQRCQKEDGKCKEQRWMFSSPRRASPHSSTFGNTSSSCHSKKSCVRPCHNFTNRLQRLANKIEQACGVFLLMGYMWDRRCLPIIPRRCKSAARKV